MRSGEVPFRQAVIDGMFVPLGAGGVDIAGVIRQLEADGIGVGTCWSRMSPLPTTPRPGRAPKPTPSRASTSCAAWLRSFDRRVTALIWFERAIPAEFADEIGPPIEIAGPGHRVGPFSRNRIRGRGDGFGAHVRRPGHGSRRHELWRSSGRGSATTGSTSNAATARGIAVCNTPDAPTVSTAEHAIALLLAVTKGCSRIGRSSSGRRAATSTRSIEAIELEGKTLGLVGFGRIARRVATVARVAGHGGQWHSIHFSPAITFGSQRMDTLDDLLHAADVVSVHVPLTGDTKTSFRSTAASRR